jgi:hypothetical protein
MTGVLKWAATAFLILGFGLFSAGVAVGWYLQILGGLIWLTAGIRMKDKPIIITNGAIIAVGIIGKFLL